MRISLSGLMIPLLVISGAAQAPAASVLCGVIRDEAGAVIPNVELKAKGKGGLGTHESAANDAGVINLRLPHGIYRITFRMEVFRAKTVKNLSMPAPCFDVELRSAVQPHNIT